MKPVDQMTNAEIVAEARRRDALRRRGLPLSTPTVETVAGIETPDEAAMREKREDEHQKESRRLMQALGFRVVNFSIKKRAKVTPGIPDTKYYHTGRGLTFWHEDKAVWGRQSPAQRDFQEMAEACGERYVLGPHQALKDWLVAQGIAAEEGGLLVPLPYTPRYLTRIA